MIVLFLSLSSQLLRYPQIIAEMPGLEKQRLRDTLFDCNSAEDMKNLTGCVMAAISASNRIRSQKDNEQDAIYKDLGGISSDEKVVDDSDDLSLQPHGAKSNVNGVKRKGDGEAHQRCEVVSLLDGSSGDDRDTLFKGPSSKKQKKASGYLGHNDDHREQYPGMDYLKGRLHYWKRDRHSATKWH